MAVPHVVRILERLCRQPTTSFHEHAVRAEAAKLANVEAAIPVELTIDCHSRSPFLLSPFELRPASAAPTNTML